MAFFSPKLFKAASGAEVMPISDARSDEPFESPVFEDYIVKNDIAGYMTALWKGVPARDIESMRVLFYLSVKAEEPDNALTLVDMLMDEDDEYGLSFWYYFGLQYKMMEKGGTPDMDKVQDAMNLSLSLGSSAYKELHPDFQSYSSRFAESETALLRAYITNVGRQVDEEAPKEEEQPEFKDCAPQQKKDEWRSLYHRDDCSANQMSIYNEALPYAKQGDPYAMFIVGYLLNRGIKTKYSNPDIVMLAVDHQQAATWLRRAAKAGIDKACWEAACALSEAWYVPDSAAESNPEIRELIKLGAEKNDPNCLEWLFKNTEDLNLRFAYLSRLAEVYGTRKYELTLSEWLAEGRGCKKDEKRAYEIADTVYRHSSISPYDDTHDKAATLLARYLENGIGCEPDPVRADGIRGVLDSDWDDMMDLLSR